MRYTCLFDPKKDTKPTVEGLETDLSLAIRSGVVMDTGMNPTYNDIDDPANIHGRVSDVFDAINAQRQILSAGRLTQSSHSEPIKNDSPTLIES